MTIRTNEEHDKLNTKHYQNFGKYLPVSMAYLMPLLFRKVCDTGRLNSEWGCKEEIRVVQMFLDNNFETMATGFPKTDKDGKVFVLHRCKLEYHPNIRTFCEANSGIEGKPSIGISFKDADDSYNDWVWVAVDVILSYRFDQGSRETLCTDEMKRMFDCIMNIGDVNAHGDDERIASEYGYRETIEKEKNDRWTSPYMEKAINSFKYGFSDYCTIIRSWWDGDGLDKFVAMIIVSMTAAVAATVFVVACSLFVIAFTCPLKLIFAVLGIYALYRITKWLASNGGDSTCFG